MNGTPGSGRNHIEFAQCLCDLPCAGRSVGHKERVVCGKFLLSPVRAGQFYRTLNDGHYFIDGIGIEHLKAGCTFPDTGQDFAIGAPVITTDKFRPVFGREILSGNGRGRNKTIFWVSFGQLAGWLAHKAISLIAYLWQKRPPDPAKAEPGGPKPEGVKVYYFLRLVQIWS